MGDGGVDGGAGGDICLVVLDFDVVGGAEVEEGGGGFGEDVEDGDGAAGGGEGCCEGETESAGGAGEDGGFGG